MPHYKLTGYHSHRHPFLGDVPQDDAMVMLAGEGDMIDLDNPLAPGTYEALAGTEDMSIGKVARPFVAGITSALVVYGLARTYKVDKKKAKQVAVVFGGVNILVGLASDYLYREMKALTGADVTPAQT